MILMISGTFSNKIKAMKIHFSKGTLWIFCYLWPCSVCLSWPRWPNFNSKTRKQHREKHTHCSCSWFDHAVSVLVSARDQMITGHHFNHTASYYCYYLDGNKQPSVRMTSEVLHQGLIGFVPPLLSHWVGKRLTVQQELIYGCPACSEIPPSILLHMCRLFTEKRNSSGMAVHEGLACYGY